MDPELIRALCYFEEHSDACERKDHDAPHIDRSFSASPQRDRVDDRDRKVDEHGVDRPPERMVLVMINIDGFVGHITQHIGHLKIEQFRNSDLGDEIAAEEPPRQYERNNQL